MTMKKHGWAIAGLAVAILTGMCLLGSAQGSTPPRDDTQYEAAIKILCHMSGQLRLVGPLATYAILSPIRSDQRVYAQYIVNLLEGSQGKHYVPLPVRADFAETIKAWGISVGDPGLIEGACLLANALEIIPYNAYPRLSQDRVTYASKNISFLLGSALDEARASLGARSIDNAADHMRLAYAYAFTALGEIGTGINPGSVIDLIVLFKGSPVCR